MQRQLVVSDIHGMCRELMVLLEYIHFAPEKGDHLRVLGDNCDRGLNSKDVFEYFMWLKAKYPEAITLLMGNHEDMLLKALCSDSQDGNANLALWLYNGGTATLKSFGGKLPGDVIDFIKTLPLYAESEQHIFVHGGVNPTLPMELVSAEDMLWSRSARPHYSGKTVVVGHSIHETVTYYPAAKTLYIDTGACKPGFGRPGRLSIVDLTNGITHWVRTGGKDSFAEYGCDQLDPGIKRMEKAEIDSVLAGC